MINRLSERVVSWLRREGCVEASEVPLFCYAAYSFIWGLLPFIIVTVWGIIFNALRESTLLILPFMLIRKFSGGYHLSNPGICFATSTILLGFAVWGLTVINSTTSSAGLSVAVFLSVVIICVFSPIDSEARRLSEKEIRIFGRWARVIAIAMLIVYIIFLVFKQNYIAFPIGFGIVLPACLQMPVLIKRLFANTQKKHDQKGP